MRIGLQSIDKSQGDALNGVQSLGALKQMKIGKWERRTKSVQAFFIEPERARSDYLQVHGTTAGRFTFRKLKLQYLQARARSGQTPPHSGQDFE